MNFVFHDGGRAAAGYKGKTGDCVTRSIAIATGKTYQEVYDTLNQLAKAERRGKRKKKLSNSRTGVLRKAYQRYLESLGWRWTPTMTIGAGCRVHLKTSELPQGPLLVKVSRHLTAVIDGVIYDTHDCSRDGARCVYGYFSLSGRHKRMSWGSNWQPSKLFAGFDLNPAAGSPLTAAASCAPNHTTHLSPAVHGDLHASHHAIEDRRNSQARTADCSRTQPGE